MYLINAFNSNAIDRTPPQTPFWKKLQMARLFAKPTKFMTRKNHAL